MIKQDKGLRGVRGVERRARAFEARRYVAAMRATVACSLCARVSKRRVGELMARRPLDWYPLDGSERKIETMVRVGATIVRIEAEMQRCLPLCNPCARKR